MCDRAEQRDRDQAMNDQKRGRQDALPSFNQPVHLKSSTVANGSADHGRKRLRVNFVFWPGSTSTKTYL
jgi:hypothetical protein